MIRPEGSVIMKCFECREVIKVGSTYTMTDRKEPICSDCTWRLNRRKESQREDQTEWATPAGISADSFAMPNLDTPDTGISSTPIDTGFDSGGGSSGGGGASGDW